MHVGQGIDLEHSRLPLELFSLGWNLRLLRICYLGILLSSFCIILRIWMTGWNPFCEDLDRPFDLSHRALAFVVGQRDALSKPLFTIREDLLPWEETFPNKDGFSQGYLSCLRLHHKSYFNSISNLILILVDEWYTHRCAEILCLRKSRTWP